MFVKQGLHREELLPQADDRHRWHQPPPSYGVTSRDALMKANTADSRQGTKADFNRKVGRTSASQPPPHANINMTISRTKG
jgi:hypothetical protein